jgi:hypothetical protein
MVNRTIRNIYCQGVQARLGAQAKHNGQSDKRQALENLPQAGPLDGSSIPFAKRIQRRFAGLLTEELPIPARQRSCPPEPL